jgi:glycosyltransferase involved in cell wall biosynthesis
LADSFSAGATCRLLVVIPTFNEAATIAGVVTQVKRSIAADVLVVSDASSDDSVRLALESGAEAIELAQQIGAWGATQAGLRLARRRGYERAATLDGDGQHDPGSLPRMLEEMSATGVDVVIGTFPQRLSGPKRLAWAWFRALTGLTVEDLTSGLRVYGPRAVEVLTSPEATLLDYQDVGVLLLLRKNGLTIREVPVRMNPRGSGQSRVFTSWLTVARYMAQTTVLCLARIGRWGGKRSGVEAA